MKRITITSDGNSARTVITVDGVKLTRVTHLRLDLDVEELPKLHLTMVAAPGELEVDVVTDVVAEAAAPAAMVAAVAEVSAEHERHCQFYADPNQPESGFCTRDGGTVERHCQVCWVSR